MGSSKVLLQNNKTATDYSEEKKTYKDECMNSFVHETKIISMS